MIGVSTVPRLILDGPLSPVILAILEFGGFGDLGITESGLTDTPGYCFFMPFNRKAVHKENTHIVTLNTAQP